MMGLTWNWVAIALSLTAASPGPGSPDVSELKSAVGKLRRISADSQGSSEITYRVRVVEMEGLEWRRAWFDKLTPVTRRGPATVWTASNRVAQPIVDHASRVVASPPKLTSFANAAAHFSSRASRSFVTQVSWSGDEPKTTSEAIREGFAATIAGRRLDQGILARVVIDDAEILSVHDLKVPRGPSGVSVAASGEKSPASQSTKADSSCSHDAKSSERTSIVQVAEVASQEVDGEWLIPNDGMLVVGLGIHTASGKDGKAVIRERLMLIEAAEGEVPRTASRGEARSGDTPLPSPSTIPSPAPPSPSTSPAPSPPTPPVNPMPTPSIPSRSLPQGVHADGTPAELPPLPEDADSLEDDGSAEPHGSPQNRPKAQALPMPNAPKPDAKEKTIDSRASKAAYPPFLGKRVANCVLQGLVAFPGREARSPGDGHEHSTRQAERSLQTSPACLSPWSRRC